MIEVRYIYKGCLRKINVKERLLVDEINFLIKNDLKIVALIRKY